MKKPPGRTIITTLPGGATLGTGAAVDAAGVTRGATENAVCDNGVGQLSDPETHAVMEKLVLATCDWHRESVRTHVLFYFSIRSLVSLVGAEATLCT